MSTPTATVTADELNVIKQRMQRYYKAYAPQNLQKVDQNLGFYRGRERQLMDDMVKKYGKPEPTTPLEPLPTVTSTTNAAGESTPAAPTNNVDPNDLSPAQSQTKNSASPTKSRSASKPPSSEPSSIKSNNASSAALAAITMNGPESYDLLRESVKDNIGFRSMALQRDWEDAWMGKIPLGNYRKAWHGPRSVIHEGYGWKLTVRAKPVQRWQRRYFVLVPNFLYYFDTDDAMSPAKGAVFMDRATITQSTQKDKKSLVIASHFHKKPLELDADGDYSTFTISFDAPKVQTVWFQLLTKIASMADLPSSTTTQQQSSPSTVVTIMTSPQQQQQQGYVPLPSAPLTPILTAVSSPREGLTQQSQSNDPDEPNTAIQSLQRQQLQSAMKRVSVYDDDDTLSATLSQSQFYPSASGRWGPHNAEGEAQLFLDGGNVAYSAQSRQSISGGMYGERSLTPHQQQYSNNNSGALQSPFHNNNHSYGSNSQTPVPQQQQQQQHLSHIVRQELREVMQQSQEDFAYRQRVQADSARHVLQVDDEEMKRRIQRVAANKDSTQLAAALMTFVVEHVSDVNALWKLMGLLDDLPAATPAAVVGTAATAQQPAALLSYEPQPNAPPSPTPSSRAANYPSANIAPQQPLPPAQPRYASQDDPLEAYSQALQRQRAPVSLGTPIVAASEWYSPHTAMSTTPPPSSRTLAADGGRLLSPEPGVVPAPAARAPLAHPQPYQYNSSNASHASVPLAGDVQWEQRMGKIQARKRMIENILGGIGS